MGEQGLKGLEGKLHVKYTDWSQGSVKHFCGLSGYSGLHPFPGLEVSCYFKASLDCLP